MDDLHSQRKNSLESGQFLKSTSYLFVGGYFMKHEEVDKLFEEVRELLRLEKLIYESKMTQEDVTRLIALAEKGHPRAEAI